MDDAALKALFLRWRDQRDPAALARVFDATAPHLLRLARHVLDRRADAEDAVQGTFLVALERAERFDPARPFLPWLTGVLLIKSKETRRRLGLVLAAAPQDVAIDDPHALLEDREALDLLRSAIAALPAFDRDALLAGLVERTATGPLPGALRIRVHRTLARLRRMLPGSLFGGLIAIATDRRALAAIRGRVLTSAAGGTAAAIAVGGATMTISAKAGLAIAVVLVAAGTWVVVQTERATPAPANGEKVSVAPLVADSALPVATPATRELDVSASEPAAPEADEARRIRVRVVDEQGAPVAAATTIVGFDDRPPDPHVTWTTDAEGRVALDPPAAAKRCIVIARRPGGGAAWSGGTPGNEVLVNLPVPVVLAGKILRPDGMPAPFARLELFDSYSAYFGRRSATADSGGRYRFEGLDSARICMRATSVDEAYAAVAGFELGDSDDAWDVTLDAIRSVTLMATRSEDGLPLENAFVAIISSPLGSGREPGMRAIDDRSFAWRTTTGPDGTCSFVALPRSRLSAVVRAPGRAPVIRSIAAALPDDAVALRVALDAEGIVAGVVTEAHGAPVAGAIVSLLALDTEDPETVDVFFGHFSARSDGPDGTQAYRSATAADGSFRIREVPATPALMVLVDDVRRIDKFALGRGEHREDLRIGLPRQIRLEGTMTAPAGVDLATIVVNDTRVGRDGRFAFAFEDRERLDLVIFGANAPRRRVWIEGPFEDVHRVALAFDPGRDLRCVATYEDGRPARAVPLTAYPQGDDFSCSGGFAGMDGRVRFRVPVGIPVEIKTDRSGLGSLVVPVVAAADQSELTIAMRAPEEDAPPVQFAGVVQDAVTGAPLAAKVALVQKNIPVGRASVATVAGAFTISARGAGTFRLVAAAKDHAPAWSDEIAATAGQRIDGIVLRAMAGVSLRVGLESPRSSAIDAASIELIPQGFPVPWRLLSGRDDMRRSCDGTGGARFGHLPAGRYLVRVTGTGSSPIERTVDLGATTDAEEIIAVE